MEAKIKLFERKRRKELSHRCGVYAIFVDNHIYVGSSEDLSRRLTEHRMTIPKGKKGCKILNELYKNYSKDDFFYAILEYCSPTEKLAKERHYIDVFGADCNTAKNPEKPVTHSSKVYQYDIKGNYLSEYSSVTEAARVINGKEGNISIAAIQHRYAYNSLWAFERGDKYPFVPRTKLKTKKIYMFDSSYKLIQEFDSISDTARFLMSSFDNYKNFDSLCNLISYHCSKQSEKKLCGFNFSFSNIHIPKQQSNND